MPESTSLQRALSLSLGTDVCSFIDEALADERSLRWIARRIEGQTGVRISPETIRNWATAKDAA